MKAILVIDMPNSCEECDYCGFYQDDVEERACLLMEGHFIGKLTEGERDVRCPLKPLPTKIATATLSDQEQERTELFTSMALLKTYADGWNDCLKGITND